MKTITFHSVKGGIGKSTISIIIANMLSKAGFRVLIIDTDFQNSTSFLFLPEGSGNKNIYNVLMEPASIKENIIPLSDGLHIITSSLDLLLLKEHETTALKQSLKHIENDYDFVIIDCHPTMGDVEINTIIAADQVICPVEHTLFDLKTAEFIKKYIESKKIIELDKWKILFNSYTPPRSENVFNTVNIMNRNFKTLFKDHIIPVEIPKSSLMKKYIEEAEPITKAKNKIPIYTAFIHLYKYLTGTDYKEGTI